MARDAIRALEKELGAPPPAGLAGLDDGHLRDLAEALKLARRRQAKELAAAGEHALRHIPRVLRGPIRRVMR